ncbi:MAG: hypothetical protein HZA14_03895 [Nitrospirae bacterium]|nr:hypothetical protein [Nitrospirota bacterium]
MRALTIIASGILAVSLIGLQGDFPASWSIFLISLLLLVGVLIRKCAICLLESKAIYDPDRVLGSKKPFYTNRKKWACIREKALIHKEGQDEFCRFLDFIKPYYLTDRKVEFLHDEGTEIAGL